jgi:hypothetical protein
MMVTGQRKLRAILFVGIAIAAILMLAATFRSLELSPEWHSLPSAQRAEKEAPTEQEPKGIEIPAYLFAAMLILCLALMAAIIIVGLVSPKTRKQTFRHLILILSIAAILLALNSPPESLEPVTEQPTKAVPLEDVTAPTGVESVETSNLEFAADQPAWVVWGIAIALSLLVAAGLTMGGWFIWRYTHPPATTLEQFAQEAQEAIDALRAGADPKDTVLRCYLEMSRVLRKQRGITRNQAMTPREFEASLADAGLPNEQIQQLTRLFETVRYGAKVTGRDEGRQATDCLTAIVQACKSAP